MTSGRERYRRGESHALVEVRVAKDGPGRLSDAEYRGAVEAIAVSGVVPPGVKVMTVAWAQHRNGAVSRMKAGDVVDLTSFGGIVSAASIGVIDRGVETVTVSRISERVVLTGNERWRSTGRDGYKRGQFVPRSYVALYPGRVYLDAKTKARLEVIEEVVWDTYDEEWAIVQMEYE